MMWKDKIYEALSSKEDGTKPTPSRRKEIEDLVRRVFTKKGAAKEVGRLATSKK